MELERKNRLRQIHIVIRVEKRVCGFVCKIIPVNIPAAENDILRDCPAPVRDIEKDKEMLTYQVFRELVSLVGELNEG